MVDDVDFGPGHHAPHAVERLGIKQQHLIDALLAPVRRPDKAKGVPVQGKKLLHVAVEAAGEQHRAVGRQLTGGQLAGHRIKVGVFMGQDEAHGGIVAGQRGMVNG